MLTHVQEGLKHLNTLQSDAFWELVNSEKVISYSAPFYVDLMFSVKLFYWLIYCISCLQETRKTFAKNYDLSKGDAREIQDLCSRMFQQFESPELIASVLSLNNQVKQIGTILQNTLQVMLGELQKTR